MPRLGDTSSEARFASFLKALAGVVGHADRAVPLRDYCTGLLMPAERKSVEPMAAVTAPSRVAAQHQSLLHFVGQSAWSDEAVLAKVRELTLPAVERSGPIEAWIIDDTSFPKKGRHSVGVTRQYSGQLGKQDNCQVAVSLSVATNAASLPVAYRLYLPQDWAADPARREEGRRARERRLPDQDGDRARSDPGGCCGRDAAWGRPHGCRLRGRYGPQNGRERAGDGLCGRRAAAHRPSGPAATRPRRSSPGPAGAGHQPACAATPTTSRNQPRRSRSPCRQARGPRSRGGRTRPTRSPRALPVCESGRRIATIILANPARRNGCWSSGRLRRRGRRNTGSPPFRRTSPSTVSSHLAKLRWRIERDYQELKQELGLGHYEGRGWRGFHHHATLCIAAYAFLVAERATISPSGQREAPQRTTSRLPAGYRPRGAPDRPERHVAHSIATVRRRLTTALARSLKRCPCCLRNHASTPTPYVTQ